MKQAFTVDDILTDTVIQSGRWKRYLELTNGDSDGYFHVNRFNKRIKAQEFKIQQKRLSLPKNYIRIEEECSICLEPILSLTNCWKTWCGHSFHRSCLSSQYYHSLEHQYDMCCSMCRGYVGILEFIDGFRYNVRDKMSCNFCTLDILDELDNLVPDVCGDCCHFHGMNDNCNFCLHYRHTKN